MSRRRGRGAKDAREGRGEIRKARHSRNMRAETRAVRRRHSNRHTLFEPQHARSKLAERININSKLQLNERGIDDRDVQRGEGIHAAARFKAADKSPVTRPKQIHKHDRQNVATNAVTRKSTHVNSHVGTVACHVNSRQAGVDSQVHTGRWHARGSAGAGRRSRRQRSVRRAWKRRMGNRRRRGRGAKDIGRVRLVRNGICSRRG